MTVTANCSPKSVLPFMHTAWILTSYLDLWHNRRCQCSSWSHHPFTSFFARPVLGVLLLPKVSTCFSLAEGCLWTARDHVASAQECWNTTLFSSMLKWHNSHAHCGASLRRCYTASGPVCRTEALFTLTRLPDLFLSHFPTPLHLFHSFLRTFFFFSWEHFLKNSFPLSQGLSQGCPS